MATVEVGERHLLKTLRWYDGFVLALAIGNGVFLTQGFTIASIGALGAIMIWGIVAIIAFLQNTLFSEMATMFPEKSGGIALYANEAWKRYFSPIGPIAAFGYWCGWALVLAITGVVIGSLIQAQWFADETWTVSTGSVDIGLAHVIGAGTVLGSWLLNVLGIRIAVGFNRIVAVVFVLVLAILMFGPYLSGGWSSANLDWHFSGPWGGVKLAIVWLYLSAWTAYGSELCATFAPEYKDTTRDTSLALRTTALFMLGLFTLLPLGVTGGVGEQAVAENPTAFAIPVFNQVFGGGATDFIVIVICSSLFLSQVSSSADASRALYGLAKDDLTIKQLFHLNRFDVPGRALTLDAVVNLALIFFVASPLAILFLSNLGYISAVFFAVVGFLLLRKDRPGWPRPIRLGRAWIPIAAVLAIVNLVIIVVGASNPGLAGYGGTKEIVIAVALMSIGFVLFAFRRLVQDRAPLRFRELDSGDEPVRRTAVPPDAGGTASRG